MTTFVQLHYLTTYPPSNPNRDDQGRPKTAIYGGAPRLRLSSQSIKRAVRELPLFRTALQGHIGERTQRIGEIVLRHLSSRTDADEGKAREIADKIVDVFGKIDADKSKQHGYPLTAQLAFISPEERAAAIALAEKALAGEELPKDGKALEKLVLRQADGAADIALFGRMLADDPAFNREAAVQVSHAITTHRCEVEDDYYTAVDDLKLPAEDMGAGFVGEAGFGSGVYYLYACLDCDLLLKNLAGDRDLAARAAETFAEALAIATPKGKQNSHAHHPVASFIRAEAGPQQPRDLSAAFLKPVRHEDLLAASIGSLKETAGRIEKCYGPSADASAEMDVTKPDGSIAEIKAFVRDAVARAGADG